MSNTTSKTPTHRTGIRPGTNGGASRLRGVLETVPDRDPVGRVVTIGPDLATAMLEANPRNRPVKNMGVDKIAADLRAGAWKLNGEPIIIAWDGQINDGQHRLWAVVETGIPIVTMLVTGVDPDTFDTVDTGKSRSPADVFAIEGYANAKQLSAAARIWYWYDHLRETTAAPNTATVTVANLHQVLREHPTLPESVAQVTTGDFRARQRGSGAPAAPLAWMFDAARLVDDVQAWEWLRGVTVGEMLSRTDPRLVLRDRLAAQRSGKSERLTAQAVLELMVRSWNAFYDGRTLMKLSARGDIPPVTGLRKR